MLHRSNAECIVMQAFWSGVGSRQSALPVAGKKRRRATTTWDGT